MDMIFYPSDVGFKQNLRCLRDAVIYKRPHAPKFLNIVIDGRAVDADTAHIRPDGWFAYTYRDKESRLLGENRVELHRVSKVMAWF